MTPPDDPETCVLVIDDDEDVRDMISAILRFKGYRVAEASGGAEALGLLRGGVRPFLVLLDLMMPGMSGQEFKIAFDEDLALPRAPVVIISGDGRIAELAAAMGADGFLWKPMEMRALLTLVESFRCRGTPVSPHVHDAEQDR
jgi:two-component system OmpR family response regulator